MKVETRERVIRLFLAALLNSELSERDLESAMSEICSDPSFLFDLRLALRQSLRSVGEQRVQGEPVAESGSGALMEDAIVDAFQRRRMSKTAVRDLMVKFSPSFRQFRVPNKMPLRAMVKEFLKVAPADSTHSLLLSLESVGAEDQYLKGIVTRR